MGQKGGTIQNKLESLGSLERQECQTAKKKTNNIVVTPLYVSPKAQFKNFQKGENNKKNVLLGHAARSAGTMRRTSKLSITIKDKSKSGPPKLPTSNDPIRERHPVTRRLEILNQDLHPSPKPTNVATHQELNANKSKGPNLLASQRLIPANPISLLEPIKPPNLQPHVQLITQTPPERSQPVT